MGFFDTLFSGGAEKDAANKNRTAYQTYGVQGLGALDNGLRTSGDFLTRAVGAYDPLSSLASDYRRGSTLYQDALGINGQEGNARATGAFQAGPGYEFTRDQGIDALNRRRAAGGMLNSGNADIDALKFGTGLADQTYNGWLDRLSGINNNALSATGAAAGGQAAGYGSLADLYNQDAQNRIGLIGNVTSGQVSANNTEAAGKAAGAKNALGAGLGLASLAIGGAGGLGGLSSLGGLGSAFGGGGQIVLGGAGGPGQFRV